MKLVPRLLVLGVALPMTGLVAAAFLAGTLFRRSLIRDVDQRLYAQAAVESVSLFDGPDQKPHVHIPKSPLASEVAAFAPMSRLYDPAGHIVAAPAADMLEPAPRPAPPGAPRIDAPNAQTRTLTVGVERPGHGIYTLYLVASLVPVDATMSSFYRAVGGTIAAIEMLLLGVLYLQARKLTRRVRELIGFVPLLRTANLPEDIPADGVDDELAELGGALAEAASFLHAQKLAQQRFLANAAHQLRTPLAVLRTEIDLALRRPRESAELIAALESSRTEAARLTMLAQKLLDFESLRVQRIERETIDVAALMVSEVERYAAVCETKSLALRIDAPAPVLCAGDRLLLTQAVENLIDNALRFAPPHSEVVVAVRQVQGQCQISVADDGPGIPDDERGKVFEPFFRGRTPGSQTGLGLAFAADVALKHGGRTWLPAVERGTIVRLDLPIAPLDAQAAR